MGTTQSISHGGCGVGGGAELREMGPKLMRKPFHHSQPRWSPVVEICRHAATATAAASVARATRGRVEFHRKSVIHACPPHPAALVRSAGGATARLVMMPVLRVPSSGAPRRPRALVPVPSTALSSGPTITDATAGPAGITSVVGRTCPLVAIPATFTAASPICWLVDVARSIADGAAVVVTAPPAPTASPHAAVSWAEQLEVMGLERVLPNRRANLERGFCRRSW